jgi:hypothetical protein
MPVDGRWDLTWILKGLADSRLSEGLSDYHVLATAVIVIPNNKTE